MIDSLVVQVASLGNFSIDFATSVVLFLIFVKAYEMVTPYREFDLIGQGNTAAACSLSGACLGFAIPLASVITHSTNLADMMLWGIVALVVQVLTFFAVRVIFPRLLAGIPANNVALGVFLGAVSLVAGILNAACMVE